MKKLLALAMLLVLCTVLTGLLTGCKVSAANTMMVDDTPKVAVTSPDVPVISTEWTERQYTVSEQDETVLLTARYQIPVLTLTGSPDNSDTAAKNRQADRHGRTEFAGYGRKACGTVCADLGQ